MGNMRLFLRTALSRTEISLCWYDEIAAPANIVLNLEINVTSGDQPVPIWKWPGSTLAATQWKFEQVIVQSGFLKKPKAQ